MREREKKTVSHNSILVLYCTVLYYTVLYCTVLYCTVLYCTIQNTARQNVATSHWRTISKNFSIFCTSDACHDIQCLLAHVSNLSVIQIYIWKFYAISQIEILHIEVKGIEINTSKKNDRYGLPRSDKLNKYYSK